MVILPASRIRGVRGVLQARIRRLESSYVAGLRKATMLMKKSAQRPAQCKFKEADENRLCEENGLLICSGPCPESDFPYSVISASFPWRDKADSVVSATNFIRSSALSKVSLLFSARFSGVYFKTLRVNKAWHRRIVDLRNYYTIPCVSLGQENLEWLFGPILFPFCLSLSLCSHLIVLDGRPIFRLLIPNVHGE
jgi:hypothetical protein